MKIPTTRRSMLDSDHGRHVRSQWLDTQTAVRFARRLSAGMAQTYGMVGVR